MYCKFLILGCNDKTEFKVKMHAQIFHLKPLVLHKGLHKDKRVFEYMYVYVEQILKLLQITACADSTNES